MKVISILLVLFYAFAAVSVQGVTRLTPGNSLSVNKKGDFLISPKGTFTSGFYKVGTNAYCYAIWFTNSVNKTVAWMANRDHPVEGKLSKLHLQRNGNLVLTQADGSTVWSSGTSSKAYVEVRLLETGNLVLVQQTSSENVLWESFSFPTDTLLPNQALVRNTTLVSMRGRGTYFSGYYNLKFGDDNVLYLIYNGPLVSSIYWPLTTTDTVFYRGRTPYDSSRRAFLNVLGRFVSSDQLEFKASDYGLGPQRRLTLDYDGNLRLYSLNESNGLWEITWCPGDLKACDVHGICGPYGICSYNPMPTCSCPYGFYMKDPSDWAQGCLPQFNLNCTSTDQWDFISYPETDYYGYDLDYGKEVSLKSCKDTCLNDCRCQGFGYSNDGQGQCYRKRILLNGAQWSMRVTYIKVPRRIASSQTNQKLARPGGLNCSDTERLLISHDNGKQDSKGNYYMRYLISFIGSFAVTEVICIGLGWWFLLRKHPNKDIKSLGYIALAMGFKRFTFSELKRATQNFKQEIGRGGFGTVYRGVLDNERVVAVKRLEGVSQGDAEFWAEVSIIGKLNHRNLVKMWGFCVEKEQKMLVYDFMENGSLDRILFSDSSSRTLSWEERHNIALGTAKGLSYIHEECLEWVLHCDVKPQNILLTDQLEPQLTDFGLSKLFKDNLDTGFSKIRGTRGYLAPEWMTNSNIDAKADVYSYGIVLLELLTGQIASSFQPNECYEGTEHSLLVQFVRQMYNKGSLEEVIDPRLNQKYDSDKLHRMVQVAFLCVEEDRKTRPAMSRVVDLLTGHEES